MKKTEKRFRWLKLNENFFSRKEIDWLEDQENGQLNSIIYLKLCLITLNTNGVLVREIGSEFHAYSTEKLAAISKTTTQEMELALAYFLQAGLMEIDENGNCKLVGVEEMTGSETIWAKYKQNEKKKSNTSKGKMKK